MIIHSLRSSLCDKVTYSHQSKKKKRGFANYSSIQTFHGTFIKKYWCVPFIAQLLLSGRHRFNSSQNLQNLLSAIA